MAYSGFRACGGVGQQRQMVLGKRGEAVKGSGESGRHASGRRRVVPATQALALAPATCPTSRSLGRTKVRGKKSKCCGKALAIFMRLRAMARLRQISSMPLKWLIFCAWEEGAGEGHRATMP